MAHDKQALRNLIIEKIRSVDRDDASDKITAHVKALLPEHGRVLAYIPLHDEPDISEIIATLRAESRLVLVEGRGRDAHLEPDGAAPVLAIVPGRAFDRRGARLGRGGGTFDRILAALDCPRIGVAFEVQLLDEIPCEAHDVRMDTIITEERTLPITRPSSDIPKAR